MYQQFPNQSLYHHNAYQECSINRETKKIPETVTENNKFPTFKNQHTIQSDFANPGVFPEESTSVKKKGKNIGKSSNVDTSNFSIEERLVAAVWVHERKRTKTSIGQIKNEFRQRFGRAPPAKNTLLVWERKLFSSGSVHDAPRPGRPINRKSHIDEVAASIRSAPAMSLRARAAALRVPHTTLRTILQKDLPHIALKNKESSQNKAHAQPMKKLKKQILKKIQSKIPEHTSNSGHPAMSVSTPYNFHNPNYLPPHSMNQNGYAT